MAAGCCSLPPSTFYIRQTFTTGFPRLENSSSFLAPQPLTSFFDFFFSSLRPSIKDAHTSCRGHVQAAATVQADDGMEKSTAGGASGGEAAEEAKVPLLQPRAAVGGDSKAGVEEEEREALAAAEAEWPSLPLRRRAWEENKKLWVVAGPSIFTRFASFGVTVISQAFIGHIGATELAAYALVSTVLMRFSNGILLGMASALETLCGQSYGAKQYHMLGIYLQRSWIILFACAVVLLPVYLFTEPLLVALGQDPEISAVAGTISLWYIPVMFSYVWAFTLQMYLQAQSKNMIITYLAVLNLGLHLVLSWLMTVRFHLGLAGVMGSMVIAMWIPVFGQLAFVFFGGCPLTWTGFSSTAFADLGAIIKLSLSSGVMLCLELWYNTILVLLTGYMKNAEIALDALSICLNINGWEMMVSIGFLAAAGVRVANELGAGSARRAKFAIYNVGAGLPVIASVTRIIASGDPISRIVGSLSGTLGYVMSELEDGKKFSEVVKNAKSLGYTEPDPRDDLGGMDVARKALILARLLGQQISMENINVESLYPSELGPDAVSTKEFIESGLVQLDKSMEERVKAASSRGNVLRYVCEIESTGCQVGLKELPKDSALGRLRGSDNVVEIYSRCYQSSPLVIQGAGAGNDTTAAGVLADIIDLQDLFQTTA